MTVVAASDRQSPSPEAAVADGRRVSRTLGLLVVLAAIITSVGSFLILTGQTGIEPTPIVVRGAGIINGLIVLVLIGIVAYEASGLWIARRRGRAAARLHIRIVLLFSFIAALPAILMMIIASVTLNQGLDRLFSSRTAAIIETSRAVAQAYVNEHSRMLGLDLLAIAGEFNRVTPDLNANASAIASYLTNQAKLRSLSTVQLIRRDSSVIVEGETASNLDAPPAPAEIFPTLDSGAPALIAPGTTNLVGGVIKLTGFDNVYLYLARPIDPRVTRNLRLTEENAAEFEKLQANRFGVQVAFGIVFAGVALVVLLSAIWIGLGFAGGIVSPIRRLIGAAREIAAGNLDVRVPARGSTGDLGLLATSFNTMTSQVRSQRDELLAANEKIDQRRRFTEAVLSGVSAGVIGLDGDGRVNLANRFALDALGLKEGDLVGQKLDEAIPALAPVLAEAQLQRRGPARTQIQLARGGEMRTFNVQVTQERAEGRIEGLVVTLDDITDLMAAQRRSAWADVARRIAHEIKNPLTPIQLSAERLRRKYTKVITEDRDIFERCTETIIRQVGDVTRMVDEFSAFARTPKPEMADNDIRDVVRAAVLDRQMASNDIVFDTKVGKEPIIVTCDRRLISQAVSNLVKNAQEAVQTYAESPDKEPGWRGRIETIVRRDGDHVDIEVIDNGAGLPKHNRNRLLEPYVTTKGNKGTGLGLAIVQKSVEQHNGTLSLEDAPPGPGRTHGALIRITLPARRATAPGSPAQERPAPAAVGSGA